MDLFDRLIVEIDRDDAERNAAEWHPVETTIVLLGDLIDRGPDSAAVVAAARRLAERRAVTLIAGNHEEMFLRALDDAEVLRSFLRFGGRETLLSYPLDPQLIDGADDFETIRQHMVATIPGDDIAWLKQGQAMARIGDYLFVHAGIRPGVAPESQSERDLRWIREPFLGYPEDHGFVVVHGHTITQEPEFKPNRIGIDTGAYYSGRLTALGLQGTARWLIETDLALDGEVNCQLRSVA